MLAKFREVSMPSNYVSMTCLSALSLHLELVHKTVLEDCKICFYQNDKRLYIDTQTAKVLNLMPLSKPNGSSLYELFSLQTRLGGKSSNSEYVER